MPKSSTATVSAEAPAVAPASVEPAVSESRGAPPDPVPAPAPRRRSGADRRGHRNEVVLAGRVTAEPAVRELPSGDHLVTWRISITRPPADQRPNQPADPITCVSFQESMEEATRGWRIGDLVQVSGSLRRRFWRSPSGSASVIEVEARAVNRISAAPGEVASGSRNRASGRGASAGASSGGEAAVSEGTGGGSTRNRSSASGPSATPARRRQ